MAKNEENRNSYILNTDISENEQHHADMLHKHKAAAYGSGYREKIAKLEKGNIVFLYESKVGIVAYGRASGILETADCDGRKDDEYLMQLDDFHMLEKPMPPSEINRITGQHWNFMQTMFSILDDHAQLLIEEMDRDYAPLTSP